MVFILTGNKTVVGINWNNNGLMFSCSIIFLRTVTRGYVIRNLKKKVRNYINSRR